MSKEIKVPTVGESISEVTVGQWFKQDGDTVQMDDVLCELESDKATFELTAESAGTLRHASSPCRTWQADYCLGWRTAGGSGR
jgi:pyruvate/2-oxoglutarate dehydrogenase complex dihydrolipoamide acyltransferase (E2) component